MPLFISDDELARHSNDGSYVAVKADEAIRNLQNELDTVKAAADAAAITAEQTCSLLEQKFLSLSAEFSKLESHNLQLQSSIDDRVSDLAQVQAQKHQLHLQSIGKDAEIERLTTEVSELHKSKRQLIELIEQKDLEISEKNSTLNTYLERIVNLTDTVAQKEVRSTEIETELARSRATVTRLSQEKELIERHNAWLNDELSAKVDNVIVLRKTHADLEEDMSARLVEAERRYNECSSSLKWYQERVKELETKITSLQEELSLSKDAAAANEEQYSAELSTVKKLVELYKESSEEWSRKAAELDGVIKALETHLSQLENDYKERLEKEVAARKQLEKEVADLQDKLQRCEAEVESSRKANELNLLPLGSITTERWIDSSGGNDHIGDNSMLVPKIPAGISGTALAASLLRDGWSLVKMYEKYQEAVDAVRHEQLGRKESEAVLQRVLCELEEKAGVILDERVEYDRMVESYSAINQKLQHSLSEQANMEKTIQTLKADMRRQEREYSLAQKEIMDLEKQVTILLKECRDVQLRCGFIGHDQSDDLQTVAAIGTDLESFADKVIPEHLLTFKDINGLVEQNVQLRSLVRSLSDQIENREIEFKQKFEMDLKKHTDEAATKVAAVLQRAEEQGRMIESLHTSVAMYKRLYEEEHKLHSSYSRSSDATTVAENGRKDLVCLLQGSQEANKKAQEKAAERLRSLEEELDKSRSDIISLRSERDKLALDSKFAREKLDSFMKEFEHQRTETNGVLARNVEFSQLIVDYQRKLRESSEALHASEELSRKLTMEISVLKNEKEMLLNSEKRACDEVRNLSERVYRLQASLDTIHSAEEVRQEARACEKRRQEEHVKQVEREWAEAKKELQQERDNVRALTADRERTLKNAMKQVEEMGKELANALHARSDAETRAAVAETKLSALEKKINAAEVKVANVNDGGLTSPISTTEVVTDLLMAKEEIEKLKAEAQANKDHMLQYRSIAEVNETALKQMELAHENFKMESEKLKESSEAELHSLRERISELNNQLISKSEEVASAAAGKEESLASALAEINSLKEENSLKISQILALEIQISSLKGDLEKEHERWRAAQANYERQVILQSETIQELTKTSQELASLQLEASDLRKLLDVQKSENNELKIKWEVEKSLLEVSKNEAEKKYDELNEQNKILHSRLEALHIQLAEKERNSAGISSGTAATDSHGEAGLQNVINYLRRSKEIAETEISLLKQEKLRLQSQLEGALKAAETAQASLHAERTNARTMLFSEEEIKSLQLQLREMNLLRESNMQLREENKHNFEECQKLREVAHEARAHSDNLESLLRERQIEIEACKKETEMERMEKAQLEKRVSELVERCRNIDVEEYDRMKEDIQHMQELHKEKHAEIEESKKLLTNQQERILKLEDDLAKSELELNQREKRINDALQIEASLKSELEKQKKLAVQWKKKSESLSKEKVELTKEKHGLSKQIEDHKQGKQLIGNISGEQVMKEKEEKDHRIQILERTLERHREELKREREDHRTEKTKRQNSEKAIMESSKSLNQAKTSFETEFKKHKQAMKQLSEEVEKLKQAEGNLPEGTSVVQILSGTILDDLALAYISAIENFERVAHSVSIELGIGAHAETSSIPVASAAVIASQAVSFQPSITGPTSRPIGKTAEEKEKHVQPKASVETRKPMRRLVRPRLGKPEEPQGDVEMPEVDGPNTAGKIPPNESEVQSNLTSQTVARKRIASLSSELNEQSLHKDLSSDMAAPAPKKAKVPESLQDVAEGHATALEKLETLAVESSSDAVRNLTDGSNEEIVAEKEEVDPTWEKAELPNETEQLDVLSQIESQNEKNDGVQENLDKPGGSGMEFDDDLKELPVDDNQQSMTEFEGEREEGELVPDVAAPEEAADVSSGSPETRDGLSLIVTTPVASPIRTDDEALVAELELGEVNSPEVLTDEKNDEGDTVEETAEGFDKSNDVNDQVAVETDQISEAVNSNRADQSSEAVTVTVDSTAISSGEAEISKQAGSSVQEAEEVKQLSPVSNASTVVNLAERARQRAVLRQSGAGMLTPPGSRGRGRSTLRGRGARSGRSGRGQNPNQQG